MASSDKIGVVQGENGAGDVHKFWVVNNFDSVILGVKQLASFNMLKDFWQEERS